MLLAAVKISTTFLLLVSGLIAGTPPLFAQLTSGPMLGHVGLRSAKIWVQTAEPSDVSVAYWPLDGANSDNSSPANRQVSARFQSSTETAGTATIELAGLEPGTTYQYRVLVNGTSNTDAEVFALSTQPLWQYRTDPPELTIALGSCAYINEEAYDRPGKSYGGGYEIFDAIADTEPDAMLWLGDNVYFREVDLEAQSGMIHRYEHARRLPEMQKLLSACPNYAIWDDHDFGPNDADRSYILGDQSREVFDLFWANPSSGIPQLGEWGGITTAFTLGDVDVFMLDNRTFRINHNVLTGNPQVLGEDQINWLVAALKSSRAPFKLVCMGGQMVSDCAIYENMAQFGAERDGILRRIKAEDIHGVVFLTGDRHGSELSQVEFSREHAALDFTCSPLTSGAYDNSAEPNSFRVEDTSVGQRNFGTLQITGPRKERVMTIRCHDASGKNLWERSYPASDL